MEHCNEKQRVWRHLRHRRMPTFGKHQNSVVGSPQHGLFTGFVHIADLRRGRTLDSTRSPAGMHPMTAGINEHLWRLYKELKGHHKTLPRDKFEEFIQNVQGDAKKPSWEFSPKYTAFTFEQFVELWWNEYSVAKRPIHREDKDLDQPISNYFINSSHNTYIKYGNQFSGVNDAEQYMKVLESGCRCVEIDVWDGEEAGDDTSRGFTQRGSSTHRESVTLAERSKSKHWSFSSMLTWMSERYHMTRSTSFPRTLKSKQSEASFKATPPRRARAISDMADPATVAMLLKWEPRVYHAVHTPVGDQALHEAIPFRTVCQKIQKYAFTNGNELPIIISLEVHANISQQKMMVKIMEHEFGERLLKQELPDCDPHTRLPTLREVMGKILIKTKTGHRTVPATLSDSGSTLQGSEPSECGFSLSPKSKSSFSGGSSRHEPVDKVAEALKKLAIYTYGPGCFKKFGTAKDADHPAHIYSIGDKTLEKLHRNEHDELFTHNKKFLARSFPDNLSSFDSSNPNAPTLSWRKGVQMVALNWQRWDTAMELNSAMFDHEDGWVLKPEGYRSTESATRQAQVIGKKRMNLTITVLAGQHVPTQGLANVDGTPMMNPSAVKDKKFRPRVTCFLHVESAAERDPNKALHKDETFRQTKTAKTDHPSWGFSSSKLHFTDVRHVVEELSFVRIHVDDCRRKWHTRTAWACIRLDRLQDGYRLIKLNSDDGLKSDGVLLVKIEKKLVDEHTRLSSLSRKTWDACKTEVTQLKSRWSCMG